MSEIRSESLDRRIDALNFAVEKSLRYHQRRRSHYEWCHRGVMFLIILLGSAAFGNAAGSFQFLGNDQQAIIGLLVAALAALDLVGGLSLKARDHEILHRWFTDLAKEVRSRATPTEALYGKWAARRAEIEADEFPIFWALEASCDNEVTAAWGRDREHGLVPLTLRHRLFMNWHTFAKTDFPKRKVPKSEQSIQGAPPTPTASS